MKLRSIALTLLLAGGFSTSCIKEDHSDCYNVYYLALSYHGDGMTEIFPEKIDRVNMYVFDAQNNCVSSTQLSDADVDARLTQLPPLAPGTYNIVCVGNAYESEVENLSSGDMDQILFAAKDYLAGNTVSGNDPLYWSSTEYQINPYDSKQMIVTDTAHFKSSHYDVSVDVIGVPVSDNYPVIKLVGVSPQTDFENEAKGTPTTYVMDAVHDGDNGLSAVSNIMRHSDQTTVYLLVESADGKELARISFADHLVANPQIDVTKNECLIPFEIRFKSAEVTITVPAWFVENISPEFK